MNKTLLASIIVPLYNCEDFIASTIDSVIEQTYTEWELIIIDDQSNDNSVAIVEQYMLIDKRIRLYQFNENRGAAQARNKGIKEANGRYVAFLDSDDIWYKDKLEKQINFMEKRNIIFSYTGFMRDYGEGKHRTFFVPKKVNYRSLLLKNSICNSSVVIDISKVDKVFYPDIRKRQDYALWLFLLRQKVTYGFGVNEILVKRNIRKDSISSNKLGLVKYQWQLYRDFEKFSIMIATSLVIKDVMIKLLRIK